MATDSFDARQEEFPFMEQMKAREGIQKMEAMYKVRAYDCSDERHQALPNGTCLLCKRQVDHVR